MYRNFGGIHNFSFWCILHQCVKFDDVFPNSKRKRKPILVPIVKKIDHLKHPQCVFLDHSKTLVFSDVIKIEILFKYLCNQAIRYYSSHTKKSYIEPPINIELPVFGPNVSSVEECTYCFQEA